MLADRVDGDDVWMSKSGGGFGLAREALQCDAVVRQLGAQDLERDGAVEAFLVRSEDDAHPAAADEAENLVSVELRQIAWVFASGQQTLGDERVNLVGGRAQFTQQCEVFAQVVGQVRVFRQQLSLADVLAARSVREEFVENLPDARFARVVIQSSRLLVRHGSRRCPCTSKLKCRTSS